MSDLIIELGCEELPAGSMMPLAEHLANSLFEVLSQSDLCSAAPEIFATPRRIAARFSDVGERQADTQVERRGPAKAAAFKDGEPTKALQGFMRSAGVTIEDLTYIETPKGEWIVVRQIQAGQTLGDVLAKALPNVIKTMPMPKRMRWASSSHEFIRPAVWLMALHGDAIVPLEVLGLHSSNRTFGHRFHAPQAIALSSPGNYESALQDAYVMVNPAIRRAHIVSVVQQQADALGGTAVMDADLVDEVNALVEWPVALAGRLMRVFWRSRRRP